MTPDLVDKIQVVETIPAGTKGLLVTVKDEETNESARYIAQRFQEAFPDIPILVLRGGIVVEAVVP